MARKIITHNEFPPIPIRSFDWMATYDNYEPGSPIGYGATEQEAIADLVENFPDESDERNAHVAEPFRSICNAFSPDVSKGPFSPT